MDDGIQSSAGIAPHSHFGRVVARAARVVGCAAALTFGLAAGIGAEPALVQADVALREQGPSRPSTRTPHVQKAMGAAWFEANRGQTAAGVDFLMRGPRYRAHLTRTEAVLTLTGDVEEQSMRGALRLRYRTPEVAIPVAGTEQRGKVHYLIGNDDERWVRHVPTYASVGYDGVWKGVDLRYRLDGGLLRYDVEVAPGADPRRAVFELDGADSWKLDGGRLLVETPVGRVAMTPPVAHQMRDGERVPVDVTFRKVDEKAFGFRVGAYDRTRPLVIDPTLEFATYVGGGDSDRVYDGVLAANGDVLYTGRTQSDDFPLTSSAYRTTFSGTTECLVVRFDPSNEQMVFATHYGGSSQDDGWAIAEDGNGRIHVGGNSNSSDLPVVRAMEPTKTRGGLSGFMTVLNADGASLHSATYLNFGFVRALAADDDGASYVAQSVDTSQVVKVTSNGTEAYRAEVVGRTSHVLWCIACDDDGNVYVGGESWEPSTFGTTANAYQRSSGGRRDAFFVKLDSGGSMDFSTLFGGDHDESIHCVAIQGGQVVIAGSTESTDLPGVTGASQATHQGREDAFVAAWSPDGTNLKWSTYLGGAQNDIALGMSIGGGIVAITGSTDSTDFPTTADALKTGLDGSRDVFLTTFDCDGTRLFSTYLGGDGEDSTQACGYGANGSVYVMGDTASDDLATTGAYQTTRDASFDNFIIEVSGFPIPIGITDPFGSEVEWTRGVAFSQALATVGGEGDLTWSLSDGGLPPGITLSDSGVLSGTPTTSGTRTFTVRVTDECTAYDELEVVLKINPPPSLAGAQPLEWTVGRPLDTAVSVTGGTAPLVHRPVGSLPSGLTLDPDGRLHGTPDSVGPTSFSYQVEDAVGAIATRQVTFQVRVPPAILERTFDPCTEGIAFDELLSRTGGIGPYTWSIASGTVPTTEGTIDADGRIAGTLRFAQTAQFTVRLTDGAGAVAERGFTMLIHPNPEIEPRGIDLAAQGRPYAFDARGTGGTSPLVWSPDGLPLPAGLVLDPVSGVLAGRPTSAGLQNFRLSLVDACAASDIETFNTNVAAFLEATPKTTRIEIFEPPAGGTATRVWFLELLAGTTLDVKLSRKGKGELTHEIELLDRHEEPIALEAYTKAKKKKLQLKKVPIPRTDRYFLIVRRTVVGEATLRLEVRARPASAWSGEVELGPGEETQVVIAAAPGARPVVVAKRGKKSPAVPRIVAVTSDDAAVAGGTKDKAKASKWKANGGVGGGDVRITLRNDGDTAGTVRWSAKTKAPKGAVLELLDLPSPAVADDG